MIRLLGWHWSFLPTFLAELSRWSTWRPTWTLAVLARDARRPSEPASRPADVPRSPADPAREPRATCATMNRDPAFLDECRALSRASSRYPTLVALRSAPNGRTLEPRLAAAARHRPASRSRRRPPPVARAPDRVRAVHWNIEHGNWYDQVEHALLAHPRARRRRPRCSSTRSTSAWRAPATATSPRDLARALGRYGVWAPMFLETTLGRDDDARTRGRAVERGVAVRPRRSCRAGRSASVRVVELPSPEAYQFDLERMVGRHVALVADDRASRRAVRRGHGAPRGASHARAPRGTRCARCSTRSQARRARCSSPATSTRTRSTAAAAGTRAARRRACCCSTPDGALRAPAAVPGPRRARASRCSTSCARAGFAWEAFVDREPTLQLRFDRVDEVRALPGSCGARVRGVLRGPSAAARLRLDWFAARGWQRRRAATRSPGLDGPGRASDHAPIVASCGRRGASGSAPSARPRSPVAPASGRTAACGRARSPGSTRSARARSERASRT